MDFSSWFSESMQFDRFIGSRSPKTKIFERISYDIEWSAVLFVNIYS